MKESAPLCDLQAEQSIIAACLISPELFPRMTGILDADDFYRSSHQLFFGIFKSLYEEGVEIEAETVISEILRLSSPGKACEGYDEYLLDIYTKNSITVGWEKLAQNVKQYSNRRNSIVLLQDTMQAFKDTSIDFNKSLSKFKEDIKELEYSGKHKRVSNLSLCNEIVQDIENLKSKGGHEIGVLTGFDNIDKHLSGLEPGCSHYLSAESHVGKSALALNISDYIAKAYNKTVLYFSLESTAKALMRRRISTESHIMLTDIRRAIIDGVKVQGRLNSAILYCSEENVIVMDDPIFSDIDRLASYCETMAFDHDIGLIVIDHLQLMQMAGKFFTTHERYKAISAKINDLAKGLNVPLLVLSQVNQDGKMKESRDIFNNADVVFLMKFLSKEGITSRMQLECIKGKDSGLFKSYLRFTGAYMLFEDDLSPVEYSGGRDGV